MRNTNLATIGKNQVKNQLKISLIQFGVCQQAILKKIAYNKPGSVR